MNLAAIQPFCGRFGLFVVVDFLWVVYGGVFFFFYFFYLKTNLLGALLFTP